MSKGLQIVLDTVAILVWRSVSTAQRIHVYKKVRWTWHQHHGQPSRSGVERCYHGETVLRHVKLSPSVCGRTVMDFRDVGLNLYVV